MINFDRHLTEGCVGCCVGVCMCLCVCVELGWMKSSFVGKLTQIVWIWHEPAYAFSYSHIGRKPFYKWDRHTVALLK